ncbi:MAG: hypothetical protein OXI88_13595 [Gammaproteobacteria bacterium]|nr:hypothetical protein [Gammaproteobacteria bacterium]MDE0285103.1 hypothetical protein [Gammaproteobacteria bacterium]MDE0512811.1 hypothetical protein [Gammaproteobacteria bacterium]
MNYELITIVVTIVGTGCTIVALIRPSIIALQKRMTGLDERMSGLEQRMARLEGLFEGFAGRTAA